ncbi:MAG: NAD regulator [Aquisalinus sp.]|nr:NAD regulator [Aquisalinus sp.]
MQTDAPSPNGHLVIGLNAVLAAVEGDHPLVLCARADDHLWGLPYGPFDPERHRTFELGLRAFVTEQTRMRLGYVEQLYTFGDKGREAPSAVLRGGSTADRVVSVGYLALAPGANPIELEATAWRNWYDHFPWEDWRKGEPSILSAQIIPALRDWIASAEDTPSQRQRRDRVRLAFGFEASGWEEERTLDRYELLYEAGIVAEAARDGQMKSSALQTTDAAMSSDHRRILATAIGRLRGKLRYRPIIFEMMPASFTLLDLQRSVEAIIGFPLHKQNFRRGIDNSGLVKKTGNMSGETGGRPAALFTFDRSRASGKAAQDRTIKGLTLPRLRQSPAGKL